MVAYSRARGRDAALRAIVVPWVLAFFAERLGVASKSTYWHGVVAHLGLQLEGLPVPAVDVCEEEGEGAIRVERSVRNNHHPINILEKSFLHDAARGENLDWAPPSVDVVAASADDLAFAVGPCVTSGLAWPALVSRMEAAGGDQWRLYSEGWCILLSGDEVVPVCVCGSHKL